MAALVIFLATAVALLALELGARALYGPPAVHMLTVDVRDVQTDFDVTYGLKADGTRTTCTPAVAPRRRLVVIGDSFAFGQGVPDGDDFVGRLSCRMRSASVTNLGVVGQEFVYYETALRSLVPRDTDDILLLIYENDLPEADAESPAWVVKRALYRWSHLAHLLRKAKKKLGEKRNRAQIETFKLETKFNNPKTVITTRPAFFSDVSNPPPARLKLFDRAFVRFMETSHGRLPKARVFVAFAPEASTVSRRHREFYRSLGDVPLPTFGEPSQLYRRAQALCGRMENCRFIDLFPALLERGEALYFPHDFHWNAEGHRAVAAIVEEALARAQAAAGN